MRNKRSFMPTLLFVLIIIVGVFTISSFAAPKAYASFGFWDGIVQFFHSHFGIGGATNPPGTTGGGTNGGPSGVGNSGNAIIQSQPITFGTQMQLDKNFLPIKVLHTPGLTTNVQWMWVGEVANPDGSINTTLLQKLISGIETAYGNQNLYIHIMNGKPKPKRSPPSDLSLYYSQVYQIALALKGKIKGYAIENEITGWTWTGTAQQYTDELSTGYKAIKAADPSALVFDSGTPEVGYGVTIINYLMEQGKTQQAMDFANAYFAGIKNPIINPPLPYTSISQVEQLLHKPGTQQTIQMEHDLFTKDAAYLDGYQTHFYCHWDVFPAVFDYINQSMLANHLSKPVQVWELGEQFHDQPIDELVATVTKDIAIAAGHRASFVNWFSYFSYGGATGLASNNGTPTPAWPIFQQTIAALSGVTNSQIISEDTKKNGIWAYEYTVGGHNLWIAWSSKPTTHALPGVTGTVTVQAAGSSNITTVNASAIPLDTIPVFIKHQ